MISLQHYQGLPDSARLFINGFGQKLSLSQERVIQERLDGFLPGWVAHNRPVQGAAAILFGRFLITAATCRGGLSGCSIDSYVRNLKDLARVDGLDCLRSDLVFYRDSNGTVRSAPHLQFFEIVAADIVTPETLVFDTLIQTLGELRQGRFQRPFKESWHATTYPFSSVPSRA